MRSLAGTTADAYRDGRIVGWRAELLGADEPFPARTLEAARFCAVFAAFSSFLSTLPVRGLSHSAVYEPAGNSRRSSAFVPPLT